MNANLWREGRTNGAKRPSTKRGPRKNCFILISQRLDIEVVVVTVQGAIILEVIGGTKRSFHRSVLFRSHAVETNRWTLRVGPTLKFSRWWKRAGTGSVCRGFMV